MKTMKKLTPFLLLITLLVLSQFDANSQQATSSPGKASETVEDEILIQKANAAAPNSQIKAEGASNQQNSIDDSPYPVVNSHRKSIKEMEMQLQKNEIEKTLTQEQVVAIKGKIYKLQAEIDEYDKKLK